MTPPDEQATLEIIEAELTRRHPELVEAFGRWVPAQDAAVAQVAAHTLVRWVYRLLLMVCLALLGLYLAEIWSCL